MLKKIGFAFLLLFLTQAQAAYAVKGHYSSGIKREGGGLTDYSPLRKMIVQFYIDKIPLRFKKYFHFTDFAYNIPFKISAAELKGYSVKVEINDVKYSGYHTAVIKLLNKNNGAIQGIDDITFKTLIYAPVAVASETIGKFQIIKPGDVKISYKNINSLNDGYYLKSENIAGREAKFFIAAGSALTKANTERKRIINFGNTVNIIYKKNGLILKTKGMALQAGAKNSLIRVKTVESGTVLNCVVKSDKIVEVR